MQNGLRTIELNTSWSRLFFITRYIPVANNTILFTREIISQFSKQQTAWTWPTETSYQLLSPMASTINVNTIETKAREIIDMLEWMCARDKMEWNLSQTPHR